MKNIYNIKGKLQDWYDIAYFTLTHLSIRRFWDNVGRWISYYNVIRKTYDFDYSSLLHIEYHQLIKLRDCISKYQSHANSWRDIRNMNWAISCLEIVLEDGCAYSNNEKPFFKESPDEKGLYHLIPNPNHKYILPIYVNDTNAKRFWKNYPKKSKIPELIKDSLRITKAWYLYNKIRKEELFHWWD